MPTDGVHSNSNEFDKAVDIFYDLVKFELSKDGLVWTDDESDHYFRKIDALAETLFHIDNYKKLLSVDDVRDIVESSSANLGSLTDQGRENIRELLTRRLASAKRYSFGFPLSGFHDFPKGYELGSCTVLYLPDLPRHVQQAISRMWKYQFQRDKPLYIGSFEEYEKLRRSEPYLCCDVKALGHRKAIELAMRQANQGLNLYNCMYIAELPPLKEYNYWTEKVSVGTTDQGIGGSWHRHFAIVELERFIKLVSDMVRRGPSCEIEHHVLSAIDLYGLIQSETPTELKFLLVIMALEGLLSAKGDKDFIGWKTRERVALLIGDEGPLIMSYLGRRIIEKPSPEQVEMYRVPARRELARKVGEMYDLRSKIAHARGDLKEEITDEEFRFASMIFRFSLQRILELYDQKGIRSVSKPDKKGEKAENESLDWFLESIKYAQPLPLKR